MSFNYTKIKMLKKIENENNELLNICNEIEINLNYKYNSDYLDMNYRLNYNNKNLFMEDIRVLNEFSFNFNYENMMNNKENYLNEFSYLYKKSNELNLYLKDIIIFYKKYVKYDEKLMKKINDLYLGEKINNIENFFYYPF